MALTFGGAEQLQSPNGVMALVDEERRDQPPNRAFGQPFHAVGEEAIDVQPLPIGQPVRRDQHQEHQRRGFLDQLSQRRCHVG
ncbi:hypothetical protein [Streptomyces sp. NWU339]|uniref:hypothetical protein n=1 Tax=Streptomyces sp. NWU339 TaxID=2185284 RepID=UPI0015E8244D|nr:hypothetical protein [Streptomyces sp. NWU339]